MSRTILRRCHGPSSRDGIRSSTDREGSARNFAARDRVLCGMYRPTLGTRDRGGAIIAVLAIHAGLLFAFLHLSGTIDLADPQEVLRTFDLRDTPPPPEPPPPPPKQQTSAKPKEKEGGSSPKNIKSEATEVVAPKPQIKLPPQPQVAVTETPRQGSAPTQGASDVRGPGTGAGGVGTGTGSGTGGAGSGGGGGGVAVAPRLLRGIGGRDYPREVMRTWPRGGRIDVILRIEANGRPSSCKVGRSFGNAIADQWTCSLIMERGQFRPAVDRSGRPVAAFFGYSQADR